MLTSHDIHHLRALAAPVSQPQPGAATLGPKGAACAISGIVRLVATKHGLEVMQRSCAKLARSPHPCRCGAPRLRRRSEAGSARA